MIVTKTMKIALTVADLREVISARINGRVPPEATLWVWAGSSEEPPHPFHELEDHDYIEVEWTVEE